MNDKLQVWSCGGGTQSCAITVLIIQGKLPKPDVCVIADTGRETRTTWEYLDGVLNPAMALVGLNIERILASEYATVDLYSGKDGKTIVIPAFSSLSGEDSKMKNFCTNEWKQRPIRRWLRTRSIHECVTWIGFSRDEQTRIVKMQAGEEYAKGLIRFPLVEIPTTRREAIKLVEDFGWPTPPRSACWMCPNHSDHEWRLIKTERPDEFEKAVQLEREMRAVDPDAWLHRSCMPLDQVDFKPPRDLFSEAQEAGKAMISTDEQEKQWREEEERARPCDSGSCFV